MSERSSQEAILHDERAQVSPFPLWLAALTFLLIIGGILLEVAGSV